MPINLIRRYSILPTHTKVLMLSESHVVDIKWNTITVRIVCSFMSIQTMQGLSTEEDMFQWLFKIFEVLCCSWKCKYSQLLFLIQMMEKFITCTNMPLIIKLSVATWRPYKYILDPQQCINNITTAVFTSLKLKGLHEYWKYWKSSVFSPVKIWQCYIYS